MNEQASVGDHPVAAPPAGCPVLHGFDPLDREQLADPYEWTARARRERPVFFMPEYALWCVTRHADVVEALSDPAAFSSASSEKVTVPMPDSVAAGLAREWVDPADYIVTSLDPPEHTRVRKFMQPTFTPRRMGRFAGRITEIADMLLDRVAGRHGMDLVTEFATPFVVRVVVLVVGIDPELAQVMRIPEWMDSHFRLMGHSEMDAAQAAGHWRNLVDFREFMAEFVERNAREPGDNLTTQWANARGDAGEPKLSDEELVANIQAVVGAGADTTANMIAQTVHRLLSDGRRLWTEVLSDRASIPNALEETLRLRAPVRAVIRTATRDVELGGTRIPAGSRVLLSLSSANLDEDHYPSPDVYDLHRAAAKDHLGFGLRTHFCLGAPLARLEGRIALERLMQRLPAMRLAHPEVQIVYNPSLIVPSVRRLEVEW